MKTIIISALTLLFASMLSLNAHAQGTAASEKEVLKMWDAVWHAYESDEAAMWNFYAEDACEVYPDGSHLCGVKAMKAGYDQFKTMLDGKPTWKYTQPEVKFIEPTVALLIGEIDSDIKLKGGVQIGGKMKFTALVHRVNGQWLIVYDNQTPIQQMPGN